MLPTIIIIVAVIGFLFLALGYIAQSSVLGIAGAVIFLALGFLVSIDGIDVKTGEITTEITNTSINETTTDNSYVYEKFDSLRIDYFLGLIFILVAIYIIYQAVTE